MSGAMAMALIAGALAIGAIVMLFGRSGAVAKRIVATMLLAAAIMLGAYAFALHGWDSGR